jgi:DHA1 family bicyclomycin/chloramphenicol resistance-like MFS transporter
VEPTLPSFFAGLALGQLLSGSLADHLGRRRPLLCGLALSVIGSLGCALSAGVASLETAGAMAGVMCAAGAGAVILYRGTR